MAETARRVHPPWRKTAEVALGLGTLPFLLAMSLVGSTMACVWRRTMNRRSLLVEEEPTTDKKTSLVVSVNTADPLPVMPNDVVVSEVVYLPWAIHPVGLLLVCIVGPPRNFVGRSMADALGNKFVPLCHQKVRILLNPSKRCHFPDQSVPRACAA